MLSILRRVETKVDRALALLVAIARAVIATESEIQILMTTQAEADVLLQQLRDEVSAVATADGSAIALIDGIPKLLADAVTKALAAKRGELAAAITQNTPHAPPAPGPVAPAVVVDPAPAPTT
jgi:hypothetical protein